MHIHQEESTSTLRSTHPSPPQSSIWNSYLLNVNMLRTCKPQLCNSNTCILALAVSWLLIIIILKQFCFVYNRCHPLCARIVVFRDPSFFVSLVFSFVVDFIHPPELVAKIILYPRYIYNLPGNTTFIFDGSNIELYSKIKHFFTSVFFENNSLATIGLNCYKKGIFRPWKEKLYYKDQHITWM